MIDNTVREAGAEGVSMRKLYYQAYDSLTLQEKTVDKHIKYRSSVGIYETFIKDGEEFVRITPRKPREANA